MNLPVTLSQLQWALLIFGLLVILVVILLSLRDKGGVKTDARGSRVITQPRVEEPSSYGISGEFDEFGVGRPRRAGEARPPPRIADLNVGPGTARVSITERQRPPPAFMRESAPAAPAARRVAPTIAPVAGTPPPRAPVSEAAPPVPKIVAAESAPKPAAEARVEPKPAAKRARKTDEKIVTLILARTDGSAMPGDQIHRALKTEGLSFGPMQIYHRKHEGKRVFSVASLLKPGYLIPEEAEGFTTVALSVFMLLPGPLEPAASFENMLQTAQRLAEHLQAEVCDPQRKPLGADGIQALRGELQAWAAGAGVGA